jgi:hypothetical protein
MVAATGVAGTALLGASLSSEPGSAKFYGQTLAAAGVYAGGGVVSGPLRLVGDRGDVDGPRSPLGSALVAALIGVGAFGVFYACALVCRHIPVLNRAIAGILSYAHRGSFAPVMITTLATGVGEELFFRGALYAALGSRRPLASSTALYALSTTITRNPALVLASVVMGTLFAAQRKITGGVQAPLISHLVWSALMLRFLPPLFYPRDDLQPAQLA